MQQTPTANVCPNGQTGPAPCSYPITLQYFIPSGTTLGTNPVQVVTQGAANLDFTLTPSSICSPTGKVDCSIATSSPCAGLAGPAYCTVPVTFAPLAPGLRMGAITITDNNGNLVATSYIYGIGQGPAIAFGPGVRSLIWQRAIGPRDIIRGRSRGCVHLRCGHWEHCGSAARMRRQFLSDYGCQQCRYYFRLGGGRGGKFTSSPIRALLGFSKYPPAVPPARSHCR